MIALKIRDRITRILSQSILNIIPAVTLALSILASNIPYGGEYYFILCPIFPAIIIYYWTIYCPNLISYLPLLGFGILADILGSDLIGFNAILFITYAFAIKSQRNYIINNSFSVVWVGFTFFLILYQLIILLLFKFNNINPINFSYILLFRVLISTFSYVPMHWLLNKSRRQIKLLR